MTKRTEPLKWWEAILIDICGSVTLFGKAILIGAGFTLGVVACLKWLS